MQSGKKWKWKRASAQNYISCTRKCKCDRAGQAEKKSIYFLWKLDFDRRDKRIFLQSAKLIEKVSNFEIFIDQKFYTALLIVGHDNRHMIIKVNFSGNGGADLNLEERCPCGLGHFRVYFPLGNFWPLLGFFFLGICIC